MYAVEYKVNFVEESYNFSIISDLFVLKDYVEYKKGINARE